MKYKKELEVVKAACEKIEDEIFKMISNELGNKTVSNAMNVFMNIGATLCAHAVSLAKEEDQAIVAAATMQLINMKVKQYNEEVESDSSQTCSPQPKYYQ